MSTLSVPLTPELEAFINQQVKSGKSPNKAAVVRYAIKMLSEEEAVQEILTAQREIASGKGITGDLRKLLKRVK